ncbi:MAG: hypothetical protein AB7O44_08725 [Hyphomicrobiaceae bacterium]
MHAEPALPPFIVHEREFNDLTQASLAAENGCLRVVTVERVDKTPDEPTNSREALDRRLDQALEQTFPASDPVSVVCTPAS